jgi:hypothetical protein
LQSNVKTEGEVQKVKKKYKKRVFLGADEAPRRSERPRK